MQHGQRNEYGGDRTDGVDDVHVRRMPEIQHSSRLSVFSYNQAAGPAHSFPAEALEKRRHLVKKPFKAFELSTVTFFAERKRADKGTKCRSGGLLIVQKGTFSTVNCIYCALCVPESVIR